MYLDAGPQLDENTNLSQSLCSFQQLQALFRLLSFVETLVFGADVMYIVAWTVEVSKSVDRSVSFLCGFDTLSTLVGSNAGVVMLALPEGSMP